MENASKKISWEKWRDPFADDEDDPMLSEQSSRDEDEDEDDEDSIIDEFLDKEAIELMPNPMRVVVTQMGVIPIMDHSLPGKVFKFWTGHTNFDITQSVAKKIEDISGVETLSILTRYRFRVGIGKMFQDRDVMHKIQKAVVEQ